MSRPRELTLPGFSNAQLGRILHLKVPGSVYSTVGYAWAVVAAKSVTLAGRPAVRLQRSAG